MHIQRITSLPFCLLAFVAACGPEDDGPSTAANTTGEATIGEATTGEATTAGSTDSTGEATTGETGDATTVSTVSTGEDSDTGTATGTSGDGLIVGPAPSTLCGRLGRAAGIAALVEEARGIVLADDRINAYFLNADVDDARAWSCTGALVGALAGCEDAGDECADEAALHAGLGVSAQDYADFVADFGQALAQSPGHTTADDRAALLATLTGLAPGVVDDPDDAATVYQRIGRKPALRAIVGAPGQAGSLLDRLTKDPTIAGFFAAADFPRLATCLTRRLAAIDGPVRYGLEVDAPAGVEPGVGLTNPCRDMAGAHAGVVDADQSPITFADFTAFVDALHAALASAGVAKPDADAVLAALDPLCVDIVDGAEKAACPGFTQTEVFALPALYAPIPDDAYDGTLASMYCRDFVVADDATDAVTRVELTLGIAHARIGDLVIKVQTPALAVLNVMTRPGYVEQIDDGFGGPGDTSVLIGAHPVRFADDAPFSAEKMGNKLGAGQAVCVQDHQCDFRPSPGKGPGTNFAAFAGTDPAGTWKVCVGDAGPGRAGTVNSLVLTIEEHQAKYWP